MITVGNCAEPVMNFRTLTAHHAPSYLSPSGSVDDRSLLWPEHGFAGSAAKARVAVHAQDRARRHLDGGRADRPGHRRGEPPPLSARRSSQSCGAGSNRWLR